MWNILKELKLILIFNKIFGISIFSYNQQTKTITLNNQLKCYSYFISFISCILIILLSIYIYNNFSTSNLNTHTNTGNFATLIILISLYFTWILINIVIHHGHRKEILILKLLNEIDREINLYFDINLNYKEKNTNYFLVFTLFYYFVFEFPVYEFISSSIGEFLTHLLYCYQLCFSNLYLLYVIYLNKILLKHFQWINQIAIDIPLPTTSFTITSNFINYKFTRILLIIKLYDNYKLVRIHSNNYFQINYLISFISLIFVLTTHIYFIYVEIETPNIAITILNVTWALPAYFCVMQISITCDLISIEVCVCNTYIYNI